MEQNQQQAKKAGTARRGFASLNSEERKNISSKGGHAAHQKGTAHKFTSEEAKLAGRKGGEKTSQNRAYMAEIGKKGGEASHAGRNNKTENNPDEAKSNATQPGNNLNSPENNFASQAS